MIKSHRFEKILEMIEQNGIMTIRDLAQILDVTETTIRRDSEELEQQGLLIRVHGGVKSLKRSTILSSQDEKRMQERTENYKEKNLVAKRAASFVKEGDCVFLDGGSTMLPMLNYLKGKKVRIVSHSTLLADNFDDDTSEFYLLGGKYIPQYNMSVGPITLNNLERFNLDHAFIGCAGIDLSRKMVYTAELETMAIKAQALLLTNHKYLLVDASKLAVKGFYSFGEFEDFDVIICNEDPSINKEEIPGNFILI